jgi:hypothetical protein
MATPSVDLQAGEDRRIARGAAALLAFGLDMAPECFFRKTRGAAAEAEARQILLAVVRRAMGESSIARLGAALGRDRTTVAHALHKIEADCEDDPDLDAFVEEFAGLTKRLIAIGGFAIREIDGRVAAIAAADPRPRAGEGG